MCPAVSLTLNPAMHDVFASKLQMRSLVVEANQFDVLKRRAQCSIDMWVRILQYATVMLSVRRPEMDPLVRTWNNEFAGYFDTVLEADSLFHYLQNRPSMDRHSLVEQVLYDAMNAARGLRRQRSVGSVICDMPGVRRQLRPTADLSASSNATLKERFVRVFGQSPQCSTLTSSRRADETKATPPRHPKFHYLKRFSPESIVAIYPCTMHDGNT
jgi:hypothetical protein